MQALRAAGIPLYLLVTASEAGTQLSLAGQVAAASRPDLASWRRLAHATGGALALASADVGDWRALHDEGMARLPGEPVEAAAARTWRELHGWPLALALPLLLWGLLPAGAGRAIASASLLVVLLPLLFTPSPAQAEEASMQAARAYRAGRWAEALPQFQRQGGYAGHMGAGAAAWRLREFALAQQHFSQALLLAPGPAQRADARYNRGNAAYAQGRWQAAAQAWRSVLASRPGDARARANLALAEAQLARRAQAPGGATDLRGRRGTTLEGRVGIEGGDDVREDAALAQQQAPATEAAAAGARLEGNDALPADSAAAIDPRLLQSGRLKMERIEDHQRAMLRGLLRQDRVADRPAPVHPW